MALVDIVVVKTSLVTGQSLYATVESKRRREIVRMSLPPVFDAKSFLWDW